MNVKWCVSKVLQYIFESYESFHFVYANDEGTDQPMGAPIAQLGECQTLDRKVAVLT